MNTVNQKLNIELPTIRKDIVLMSPGTWNGFDYSEIDIKKAFENTDWKKASELFLDHPANPNNAAGSWVGRIINQRYVAGEVIGDLEMWDTNTIIKTELARASFGVSPRVIGEDNGTDFKNFTFDNFSIVSKQAIDPSYINLSKKNITSKTLYKSKELIKENDESNLNKLKGGNNEMSETNQETETSKVDDKPVETAKPVEPTKPVEPVKEPEKKEEELSFDNLSVEELNAILSKVQKVIASKKPAVQEMAYNSEIKSELESMKKQVQELNAKLNKPAPKTSRNSGSIRATLTAPTHSEGVREMAGLLSQNFQ